MKKISISAKEFAKDLRAGETDQYLMQKYDLSARSLVRLKQELLTRGFIKLQDLQNQPGIPSPGEKRAFAMQFVSDFRKRPDDVYLMQKHSIGPQELKRIYTSLMEEGFLSEYEYHWREVKALEVEALSSSGPTTVITIVDKVEDLGSQGACIGEQSLSAKSARNQDSPKIGNPTSSINPGAAAQGSSRSARDRKGFSDISPLEETSSGEGFCPNCGVRKTQYSENSCRACGIVYSKYESCRVRWNVSIWQTDRPER